jgi:DNA polymerase III subunit epsilon
VSEPDAAPHWRDKPMTGVDAETTGVNVRKDRIVTWTCIRAGKGIAPKVRNWLINPGVEIPASAAKIHGITTERARDEGMKPADALEDIRDEMLAAWARGEPIVAYNMPFDFSIIDQELVRHGFIRLPAKVGSQAFPTLDPLVIDKHIDPRRKGSRKLIDTCRLYNVPLSEKDAHSSEADTMAAIRLMYQLASPNAGKRVNLNWSGPPNWQDYRGLIHRTELADLVHLQRTWSSKQKASFAEFKRSQGNAAEADRIEAEIGWPIRRENPLVAEPPPL